MSSLRTRSLRSLLTFTRSTVGSHCNAAGRLVSAAVDVPRIDYNPATLAVRGLLIEEARTNYLLRSEDFSHAVWLPTRASVIANAVQAPDGTITADTLVEDSTVNDSHHVYQAYTKGSTSESQTYSFSVWLKAAVRSQVRLQCQGNGGPANSAYALFDLSLGTAGTPVVAGAWDNAAARIEAWPSSWYRCMLDFRVNNDGQLQVLPLVMLANGGSVTYTGNGSAGVHVWGAQLEKGLYCTSYIPTTSAAATRGADACSASTLAPWFTESAGTVFVEYLIPWSFLGSDAATRRLVEINDGTSDNRHIPASVASGLAYSLMTRSGTTQASLAQSAHAAGVTHRQAYAWAENDVAAIATGGTLQTDAAAAYPTGLTTLHLGPAYKPNAYVRKVKFYPRRLSNSELQALVA